MNQPNIVLVNCDDLGYGDLGCYGSELNKTPALDRLAREGKTFTDFYMTSPVCSPSRAAMMTGCYPPRVGFKGVLFPGSPYGIHEDESTLPQLLKDVGYRTKLIGKWHCGDQPEFLPTERGFDEYYGLPYSNDMGRQTKPENGVPLPLLKDSEVIQEQPDQRNLTERYTEEAVRFMRENKDGPFFLYLAHMYVHVPLFVPRCFLEQSDNGGYGGAVEHIDWTMDVLMHEIETLGVKDNTIVIFTSDNGSRARDEGGSNAPLRGRKGETWEGGMRVPCIVWWPGKIGEGQECREITTAMDFLPTLVNIAGGQVPPAGHIDGHDIQQLLFTENNKSPYERLCYYRKNNLEAIRVGEWKLHLRKGDEEVYELYNLAEDVGETTNLYEQRPDIVQELQKYAEDARQELGDEATGVTGSGVRPPGQVNNPQTLTEYDPSHPYMIAMYDMPDSKVMRG